jgi:hypothetical protein
MLGPQAPGPASGTFRMPGGEGAGLASCQLELSATARDALTLVFERLFGSVQATAKPEELDVEVAGHRRHVEGLSSSRPPVRGAAHLRKLLRRELRRVGAADASLYIDGPRGVVRVRFPSQERYLRVPVSEALAQLRTLPNAAGAEAAVDALAKRQRGKGFLKPGDEW